MTDRWFARVTGVYDAGQVQVFDCGPAQLSSRVMEYLDEYWSKEVERVRQDLIARGISARDITIKEYNGMNAVYIKKGDVDTPILYSGPVVRLERFEVEPGRFRAYHSQTSYGVRRLMAKIAYDVWDTEGFQSVVDCVNVTVLVTVMNGTNESLCLFKRAPHGVAEYSGLWGTVAGGITSSKMHIFDAAAREMLEEARLLPSLSQPADYEQRGIIPRGSKAVFEKVGDKRILHTSDGEHRYAALIFCKANPLQLIGLVTDIKVDRMNQFFKSEYVLLARTGVNRVYFEELLAGIEDSEHEAVEYVRFECRTIQQFLVENFEKLMPPTSAGLCLSLQILGDFSDLRKTVQTLAREYPIADEHPFYARVRDGRVHLNTSEIDGTVLTR